ncbi:MAG: ABC transporter ATP-binding protein [Deltaproteobacteria bacterium]|jgi:oligopeptide/dipeptide ABC transporter ATP-binding protein|nr:ABC transporter ATP-binding protein [Deltaproteobacteria bacterium]MBT4269496.1 ABC transporter ATP-binding protein [Deltaproteobacteria bacterium]MBT4642951.1 ABC transporter ATP-binding protein [Deltaproteobacteria bacterium]MBT6505118.1 ABC transporter ATP-binding protein [Deltaproteobacteria bacterium]MBT6612675.1 ABC transporter ATP-binding protein [Deltaproteobacteria bacterium]
MEILEVVNLSKHYELKSGLFDKFLGSKTGSVIKSVDGVNFSLKAGEILGIAGESGCGKSTACMLITNLIKPTEGMVKYKGRNISEFDKLEMRDYQRHVQMIFQDPYESLNPRFTTFDLVAEPLRALGYGSKEKIADRVMETLEEAGLDGQQYRNRYPHQMSGGERQRVGIACALALKPEIVIADEPLSMLDVSIRAGILDLIRDLSRKMNFSSIYVSHDLSILSNISDRLLIMYLGKVMEIGKSEDVIKDPQHPYAQALISAVSIPDPRYKRPIPDIKGEVSQPIDPPPGCRFEPRCTRALDICKKIEPPMKEISDGHCAACHLL